MKQQFWFILLPVGVYSILCLYLFLVQRAILYYPTPATTSADATALFLTNENHTLKIWHLDRSADKALIYFGGNAEDVSWSINYLKVLFPDHDLYLANYRGYGGSTGSPTEEALFSDAVALHDHISGQYVEMIVKGRSLGSGVAIHLAARRKVDRLILVTPFDSMAGVARHYYPFLPVSLLMKDRYDCLGKAGAINIPTLLLIAEHDEVIPRRNSDNLRTALPGDTTSVEVISAAGHNDIERFPQYTLAVTRFAGR